MEDCFLLGRLGLQDLHLLGLELGLLTHPDLQDAVLVDRVDLLGVHVVGQREGAVERPVGALDPMVVLLLGLLELPLAPYGKDVVFQ